MTVRASTPNRRSTRSLLRGETSRRVIATLISTGMVFQPIVAAAGPNGGTVVGGNATISTVGSTTTIDQVDARVVIDWDSFDIDAAETVRFKQPTTKAVALNRVLGDLPTDIRGQLLANGHVWIVNRHGVTFHAGSVVNVGGLLATTADIANADFMAGSNNFIIPGEDGAKVINNGSITFGTAGLAGLVAPGAENNGTIAGKMGSVIVAGERTFAIDFAGDGMFAFEPKGAAGAGRAVNTGSINNGGGYILIAARTASSLVDESISLGGVVAATSAEMKNGRIVLSGGDGLVNVSGTLDASGGVSQTGGSVKVSGGLVDVKGGARVDVSGGLGGGTAEIGGGYQGASMGTGLRNAQATRVQQGASIAADAGQSGDGGTVVVWADGNTGYAGSITATGGALSGNGGTVEVSGKQNLTFAGTVDTRAPLGSAGTLLLDPDNITISATADDVNNINVTTLETALNMGNVVVSTTAGADQNNNQGGDGTSGASGDIAVQAAIDSNITVAGGTTLTFRADGNFSLDAGAGITDSGAEALSVNVNAGNTISLDSAIDIDGDVSLTATTNAIALNDSFAVGGNVVLNAGSAITQMAPVTVGGTLSATAVTDVTLTNMSNDFTGAVSASGVNVEITNDNALMLGNITAQTGGSLNITTSNDMVEQLAATRILATDVVTTVNAGTADVTLANAMNNFGATGAAAYIAVTGGAVEIVDANSVLVDASNVTDSLSVTASAGDVTLGLDGGSAISVTDGNIDAIATNSVIVNVDVSTINSGDIALTSNSDAPLGAGEIFFSNNGDRIVSAADGLDLVPTEGQVRAAGPGQTITLESGNAIALPKATIRGNLIVDAGGSITQTGTLVTDGTLTATAGTMSDRFDVVLANVENALGRAVSVTGEDITIRNSRATELGAISASADGPLATDDSIVGAGGNVDIATTSGAITQTDAMIADGTVTVETGADPVIAGNRFDVALTHGGNSIAGAITATGEDVSIRNTRETVLGNISATADAADFVNPIVGSDGQLDVATTSGRILQEAGTVIAAPGGASFTTEGGANIRVDGVDNAFTSVTLDTDGAGTAPTKGVATVKVGGALELASVDARTLLVTAKGDVTQDADLSISGITAITATGVASDFDVTLENSGNDFGEVQVEAKAVSIADTGDIALGRIVTSEGLKVVANNAGDISDTATSVLRITGATELTAAGGVITVDKAGHTFTGNVTLEATQIAMFAATGMLTFDGIEATDGADAANEISATGDIVLDGLVDIAGTSDLKMTTTTGTITQTTDNTITAETLQVESGGATTLNEDNDVDRLEGLQASGTSSTTGSDLSFTSVADELAFLGNADSGATSLTVNDIDLPNPVVLGTSALTINSTGAVRLGGTDDGILPTGFHLDQDDLNNITAENLSLASTGGADITAEAADATNTGNIDKVTLDAGAGDVRFEDGVSSFEALTVTDSGGIENAPAPLLGTAGSVTVTGLTDLTATGNIQLDNEDNDFDGAVAASGVDVELSDADGIVLADIDATNLTVIVNGTMENIAQIPGPTPADGETIDVANASSFINRSGGAITLESENNDLGMSVRARGGDISLVDKNDLRLDLISNSPPAGGATGSLTVVAGGALTQLATAAIRVSGETDVKGTSVALAGEDNDFVGLTKAEATSGSVSLNDENNLTLGQVDAVTGISVTADGGISATDDITNTVSGITSLTADADGSMTADNISVDGGVTISTTGPLTLSVTDGALVDGTGTGDVTLLTTGSGLTLPKAVFDSLDLTLRAAGDVIATMTGTDFGATTTVTASGANIQLSDEAGGLDLGDIDTNGSLIANAVGAITQPVVGVAAGDAINVGTTTTLTTTGTGVDGAITLNSAFNDFGSGIGFPSTRAVSATGTTIDLRDTNAIVLGDIDADATGGSLTVTAGDRITQFVGPALVAGDAIDVDTTTTLTSAGTAIGGTIRLDSDNNDFGGAVTADGVNVTLNDRNAIELDDIDATGNLSVTAAETITQTAGTGSPDSAVDVQGTTSLTTTDTVNDGSITLATAVNNFEGTVSASVANGTITLADIDDLTLGVVTAPGDITAEAQRQLIATGDITSTATGSVSLQSNDGGGSGLPMTIQSGVTVSSATGNVSLDTGTGAGNLIFNGETTVSAGAQLNLFSGGGTGSIRDNGVGSGTVTLTSGAVNGDSDLALVLPSTNLTALDLVINADGEISQAATTIVAGFLTANAVGDAVIFDNPNNQIGTFAANTRVAATTGGPASTAANVTVQDIAGLTLGDIIANDLTVTAGGNIDQTTLPAVTTIKSDGTATINAATGTVVLANDGNDITDLTGTALSFDIKDVDGMTVVTGLVAPTGLEATAGAISIESDRDVGIADATTVEATGTIDLLSTNGGDVQAGADAMVLAGGALTMTSQTAAGPAGAAGGGTDSVLRGTTVILNGGSVAADTVTATNGGVDIDATSGATDGVTLTGAVTTTNGTVDIDSVTNVAISGGGLTDSLTVDARDVDLSGPSFEATNGATFTNIGGDLTTIGGAEDVAPAAVANTSFEISGDGLNTIIASLITVKSEGGAITSGGAVNLKVAGTADDIVLDSGGTGNITVAGLTADNLTVNAGAGVNAGVVDFDGANVVMGALDVDAGSVTQGMTDSLIVTGLTDIDAAGGNVSLRGMANNFVAAVDVDGAAVTITDAVGLILGTVNATTSLDATAKTGNITDVADQVITTPDATLTADAGNVVLDNVDVSMANIHMIDRVEATADAVTLNNAGTIDLADVLVRSGALSVDADGAISDSGTITVANGETTLKTTGGGTSTITIDDASGAFNGKVTLQTAIADVVFTDNDDTLELGNVTANTLMASNKSTAATSTGIDASTGIQNVRGVATYETNRGDIDLSNTANTFFGVITADADLNGDATGTGDVTIRDAQFDVHLGTINAAVLDVMGTTPSASIRDTAGQSVKAVTAKLMAPGGVVELDNVATAIGAHDLGTAIATAESITLNDANDISLATVNQTNANGSLKVTAAGGSINDTSGLEITAAGETELNASTDILLDNVDKHDFAETKDFKANGVNVTVDDVDGIQLGTITATRALAVNAGGDVTQTGVATVNRTTTIDAGNFDVTLMQANKLTGTIGVAGRDIKLNNTLATILGDIDAGNDLTVTSAAALGDNDSGLEIIGSGSDINVGGNADLSGTSVTLNDAGNDFVGKVDARGGSVELNDLNSIILGAIDQNNALGTLKVTANGSITDTAMLAIVAKGRTDMDAGASDILLDNVGTHEFSDTRNFNAAGADVTVDELGGIQLGTLSATGKLSLKSDGDVTQTGVATVAGTTTVDAGASDVTLLRANQLTGPVSIAGNDIELSNARATILGDIDAGNDLTVTSTGALRDDDTGTVIGAGANDINVAGNADLRGASIALNDADNDFVGGVDARGGSIELRDKNAIALGTVAQTNVAGVLKVTSVGSITDTAGSAVTARGSADFDAGGFDIALDNVDTHDFSATSNFDAAGGDITVDDKSGIQLGTVTLAANGDTTISTDDAGNLKINAGGAITQTGIATVPGTTEINNAGNDITLAQANRFGGAVTATGAAVTLKDADALTLGSVVTSGALDAEAATTLNLTTDVTSTGGTVRLATLAGDISVPGGITVSADDALTLAPTGGKLVDRAGGATNELKLVSGGTFVLPATNLTLLDLVVEADGAVSQVLSANVVNSISVKTSGDSVTLDKANTFGTFAADTTKDGATRAAVTVTDAGPLEIGAIIASALTATAGGDITDVDNTAPTAIRVSGLTSVTAVPGGITLDNENHDFGGGVAATATGDVTLEDATSLILGTITTNGQLLVTAGEDLILLNPISVDKEVALTAGRHVSVRAAVDSKGNPLTLTADASMNGTGRIVVTPDGSLTGGAIVASASNSVTLRNTTATSLDITKAGVVAFGSGTTDIDGPLTIASNGAVTDDFGATLKVAGVTKITAAGQAVALNSMTNDFGGPVEVTSATVSLRDVNDLTLGDVNADADVLALSGDNLTVAEDVTSTAGPVTLKAVDNVTIAAGKTVTSGGALSIVADTNADAIGGIVAAVGSTLSGNAVSAKAGADITLANTTADRLAIDGRAVSFGAGETNVADTMSLTARGPVTDRPGATLTVGGDTKITALNSPVTLDNLSNDFKGTVRAVADALTLSDENDLRIAETTVTNGLSAFAGGALDIQDIVAGETTLVATGPTTAAEFSVAVLNIASAGNINVTEGAASKSVNLTEFGGSGNVDVDVKTVLTPSLTITDVAAVSLDRVGAANASVNVVANDIALGVVRAQTVDLQAKAGDIRTAPSTAGKTISVNQRGGAIVQVDASDIGAMNTLVDVAGATSVQASGDVSLVEGQNSGAEVKNALRDVVVTGAVGGAVTIVTTEDIAVSRDAPGTQVASADVTSDKSVSLDVNALGDATATSNGGLDDNASITGLVGANALAEAAQGDASISGTVVGMATANAGTDASITGTVVGDAVAVGGQDATVNGDVDGDASLMAERNAALVGTIDGDADVNATTGNASIDGTVLGIATAKAGTDASIKSVVGKDAAATAGQDASINGTVGGDAKLTAGRNAALVGTVAGNADADATAGNASIDGTVQGDATAKAGTDASIKGAVGKVATATATNDATVNGDVGGDAKLTAGRNAALIGTVGGNADADATTGNASIDGTVQGNATAKAGTDASIKSADAASTTTVRGDATATGGRDAEIVGDVGGDANLTAGQNAALIGTVGGNADADATTGNASIDGTVQGNATAKAGTDASIKSADAASTTTVRGDATASGGRDAEIDGDVDGDAKLTAGRTAALSGKVGGDAEVDADAAIALASAKTLTVTGSLDADSGKNGAAGNGITAIQAVKVVGATTLDANAASDIVMGNAQNNFDHVDAIAISNAANVTVVDANTLDIATITDVTGDLKIDAVQGKLTLRDDGADGYRIGSGRTWTLRALAGDLSLDTQVDSTAGNPYTGSLTLQAGATGNLRIKNFVGDRSALDNVLIADAKNLIFGLRTDAAFVNTENLSAGEFIAPNEKTDIFFTDTLAIEGVDGTILLAVPAGAEFGFDFENRYFGLNIRDAGGFNYSGASKIDLFGEIGGIRTRATGLSPIGPRSQDSEFNNCLIGDPNSCSALTQANVLRLVDLTPDNVFVLDPDQVEQLFLSFGNEELWGLPSVFGIDIDDDDEEETQ